MTGAQFRTALPIAFFITGIALSCSTACLTNTVVQGTQRSATTSRQTAPQTVEAKRELDEVTRALRRLLSSPLAGSKGAADLSVTGANHVYTVEAVGDFDAENATVFAAAARELYAGTVPFHTVFLLRFYHVSHHPQTLVSALALKPLDDMMAELRRALPPASARVAAADRLQFNSRPDGAYHVIAVGQFTSETVAEFSAAVRAQAARQLRSPRFIVTLLKETDVPGGLQMIAEFETAESPVSVTPDSASRATLP